MELWPFVAGFVVHFGALAAGSKWPRGKGKGYNLIHDAQPYTAPQKTVLDFAVLRLRVPNRHKLTGRTGSGNLNAPKGAPLL